MTSYTDPSSGEPNVPGYEETTNSPINVSGTSSTTHTLSKDYDYIVIICDKSNTGFNSLQMNGDTGANYDYMEEDGATVSGSSAFPVGRPNQRDCITLSANSNSVRASAQRANGFAPRFQGGDNLNVTGPINQFTLFDDSGTNRSTFARVYGLQL